MKINKLLNLILFCSIAVPSVFAMDNNRRRKRKRIDTNNQVRSAKRIKHSNIFDAVKAGDLNAVKAFVEQGVSIEDTVTINNSGNGHTLLHLAAKHGNLEMFKYLAKIWRTRGLDINTPITSGFYRGDTPLHLASFSGNVEMIKYLHLNGADINASFGRRENEGSAALNTASMNNHIEAVYYLVKYMQPSGLFNIDTIANLCFDANLKNWIMDQEIIKKMIQWRMNMNKNINFIHNRIAELRRFIEWHKKDNVKKAQFFKEELSEWIQRKDQLEKNVGKYFDKYAYDLIKDGAVKGSEQCRQILLYGSNVLPFRSWWINEKKASHGKALLQKQQLDKKPKKLSNNK